jgi:hypothetical protein
MNTDTQVKVVFVRTDATTYSMIQAEAVAKNTSMNQVMIDAFINSPKFGDRQLSLLPDVVATKVLPVAKAQKAVKRVATPGKKATAVESSKVFAQVVSTNKKGEKVVTRVSVQPKVTSVTPDTSVVKKKVLPITGIRVPAAKEAKVKNVKK